MITILNNHVERVSNLIIWDDPRTDAEILADANRIICTKCCARVMPGDDHKCTTMRVEDIQ